MAKAKVEVSKAARQSAVNLAALEKKRVDRLAADPKANTVDLDKRIKSEQADVDAMTNVAAQLPSQATDSGHGTLIGDASGVHSDIPWLDRQLRAVNENRALYAYKMKMASYKFSWALIPISVPFIWLLFFWRRDVGLYDHAIFAIHSLSFMTLLVCGLIGLHLISVRQGWLWVALLVVPPIHMYKHLKGAYRLGRFGAGWRTFALLVMTTITSLLFFLMLVWLEAE
jgi:hypothetical protein